MQESAIVFWLAKRAPALVRPALWGWGQYYGRSRKSPHWLFSELTNFMDYSVPVTVRLPDGQKMTVPINDTTGQEILHCGYTELVSVDVISSLVKEGGVFFDLGAHVGQFTLIAGRLAGPAGSVHSFEPDPQTFGLLAQNVRQNRLSNVSINQMAVSGTVGSADLYLGTLETAAANSLRKPPHPSSRVVTVPVTSIDAYCASRRIDRIDVMKIDVEGAELDVLQGARRFLAAEQKPALHIEFHPVTQRAFGRSLRQLADALLDYGYVLFRLTADGLRKFWLDANEEKLFNVLALSPRDAAAYPKVSQL